MPEPDSSAIQHNGHGRYIAATYDYVDEAGTLLYQVVRFAPKDFRQRRPDGNGDWIWSLDGVGRIPYRLPDLLAADPTEPVLILEGEKDCDRLAALGFVATTNVGGAGKWKPEYSQHLRDRRVCILPDNDDAGQQHVAMVAQSLQGIAGEIQVLRLPGLAPKGDVSDWLNAGGAAEELTRLIKSSPAWSPAGTTCREPIGVVAASVRPESVVWLSPGRLAAGKATILDGDPELGKSTLSLECTARITRGEALPGGEASAPRGAVILSAEDGIADTIVPRLIAANADLNRVFIMEAIRAADGAEEAVTVPGGLDAVERAIRRYDAALLVVDPLVAFLGADTNSNRDRDVRRAMAPLAAMLERTGCAGLLLRHLNKALGGQAIYRGGGSIGIIGAARIGLLAARDPDDDEARILAPVKVNIGPHPPALRYRLKGVPGTDVARLVWDDQPVSFDAAALLAAATGGDEEEGCSALDEAQEWLQSFLKDGPQRAPGTIAQARKDGIAERTLRRAKATLGIASQRDGPDWVWLTPMEAAKTVKAANPGNVGNVGSLDENPRNYAETGAPQGCQAGQDGQGCQASGIGNVAEDDAGDRHAAILATAKGLTTLTEAELAAYRQEVASAPASDPYTHQDREALALFDAAMAAGMAP